MIGSLGKALSGVNLCADGGGAGSNGGTTGHHSGGHEGHGYGAPGSYADYAERSSSAPYMTSSSWSGFPAPASSG